MFDVEDFSARYRDDRARLAVRAVVFGLVRESFATAGIDWDSCLCQDCGDGALVVVPADVSKVLLLDPLLPALSSALVAHNRQAPPAERIRLRLAVHAGEITYDEHGVSGYGLVVVSRLLDAAELRHALARTDVPLVAAVTELVYETVVRHGFRDIRPATYHPVVIQVKKTRLCAWVHLPGSAVPPSFGESREPVENTATSPQLLPVLPILVGRDVEQRLLEKSSAESRLLVVVGPPGVGKSNLALWWAHQARDQYPDGQLYADLGGSAGSVAVEQVLGQFLRALGVDAARVPVQLDEQTALFRSVTADLRLLVVLDGVESAAQVRALLSSSPRSMTVVTSRAKLGGLVTNGGRLVAVGPMPDQEAAELLARLVGDERIERDWVRSRTLAALCGGLPLALCVVAARLVAHPQWTVERAAADLTGERSRLARLSIPGDISVQVVFDMSYEALSAPAARLYRHLGLHPGLDFEVGLVAAAMAVPIAEAEPVVEELATANLVEDVSADRCRLHDLIRLHARQKAMETDTEADRTRAVRRMVDWYLHTATTAGSVVTPHRTGLSRDVVEVPVEPATFAGHGDALEWLDRERLNLLAAAREAADRGWHATSWQLADSMWGLFLYRTHYYDWLQFDLLAVRETEEDGDRAAHAEAHDRLGLLYHALHRNDEALTHMARAAGLWRELGDEHRIANSMERFGFAYLDQDRIDLALDHFEQALAGYRHLAQPRSVGLALVSIGRALTRANRADEAEAPLAEAVTVLDRLTVPDPYNAARARIALARAEIRLGGRSSTEERLRAAATTMHEVNSPLGQADAWWALGELYEHAGDVRLARTHYVQTEEVYTRLGNPGVDQVREHIAGL